MKAKCALCDKVDQIDDRSFLAKRLRNHYLKTYLCKRCDQHIRAQIEKRPKKKTNA